MWRWPLADPREVVDLAGAGTLADGPGEADLAAELRHWRGVVARQRLVALLRRQGAIALALAALLEILSLVGFFPQWVVVAVPLAALLVGVAWSAARGPAPFDLARLLDDKLGLNDRLSTTRRRSCGRAARTGTPARRGRVASGGRRSARSSCSPW
jgi:hypothetical protein